MSPPLLWWSMSLRGGILGVLFKKRIKSNFCYYVPQDPNGDELATVQTLRAPISLPILVISIFPLFPLVSLARSLSILLIFFQRTITLFHWFFLLFLFSISLIPALSVLCLFFSQSLRIGMSQYIITISTMKASIYWMFSIGQAPLKENVWGMINRCFFISGDPQLEDSCHRIGSTMEEETSSVIEIQLWA